MGLREKLRDFGSKIVHSFQKKPKVPTLPQMPKDMPRVDGLHGRIFNMTPEQKAALQKQNNMLKGGGN